MYLGIDVGTSGVKAVLMGEDGQLVAQAQSPLSVMRPHPLWSEQSPQDWWDATCNAVLQLPASQRAAVSGVGLSGQMHGATFLDSSGKPLRPAILWNDGRSFEQCKELERLVPQSRSITGNLAMPGFTAPKALWLRENEPDLFAQTVKILLPKDYVRYCMSGDYATDVSDASGTLWLDVGKRTWSEDMLSACDLTADHMPAALEGSALTGELSPAVAADWGMSVVPIVAGGGDNAAGAVGAGIVGEGDSFMSLGTSGVLFVAGQDFRPNPEKGIHAFCHCLPDRWHEMTVMLSAASCLDWAANLTGAADVPALLALTEAADPKSNVLFLPYLSGERTPHNDPYAQSVFFGMTADTGPAELAKAVLEGVAFGFADGLDVLKNSGAIETVTVIGGGARSSHWGRILASTLGKPLVYRKGADVGPAFGAARLARLGVTNAPVSEVCAPPEVLETIEPITEEREVLLEKLAAYRQLYSNVSDLFPGRGRAT